MNEYKKETKLRRSKDLYHLTRSHLEVAAASVIPIEFPFLKDFMMGILPTELLLVGAKTGMGKTGLLTEMALMWSKMGKRVVFIALEAEPEEIEQRILYKIDCQCYLSDPHRDKSAHLDFRKWRFNMLAGTFNKYEEQAFELFKKQTENLSTYYMDKEEFTVLDLWSLMDEVQQNGDVCIIDHLHYFDMLGSQRDLDGMKGLMKRIRHLNQKSGIPFVMAAHLRKDVQNIMPALEDFMGSSDIPKIATSAILIAPKPDSYKPESGTVTTLFSVPKLRGGGGTQLLAEIEYSIIHQQYLPLYTLSMQNIKGDKVTPLEKDKYPRWAKTPDDQWTFDY